MIEVKGIRIRIQSAKKGMSQNKSNEHDIASAALICFIKNNVELMIRKKLSNIACFEKKTQNMPATESISFNFIIQ